MTNREFLEKVINANINEEMTGFANAELEKLNSKNAKRRTDASSKKEIENAPLRKAIVEYMAHRDKVTASKVAEAMEVSPSKASALLTQLVNSGMATKEQIAIPKVGKRFAYSLVKSE